MTTFTHDELGHFSRPYVRSVLRSKLCQRESRPEMAFVCVLASGSIPNSRKYCNPGIKRAVCHLLFAVQGGQVSTELPRFLRKSPLSVQREVTHGLVAAKWGKGSTANLSCPFQPLLSSPPATPLSAIGWPVNK